MLVDNTRLLTIFYISAIRISHQISFVPLQNRPDILFATTLLVHEANNALHRIHACPHPTDMRFFTLLFGVIQNTVTGFINIYKSAGGYFF
jgi:hypothetical protein